MERRRPHSRGVGDGFSHDGLTEKARVRGKLTPAPAPAPDGYGRQGQGQLQNPSDRHGSTLQLADRKLQRIPGSRLLPSRREFQGYAFQAPPPHLQISLHHQPHPRPHPPTYQPISRENYTMVGKVSERVLAREGEYFWECDATMMCTEVGERHC